MPEFLTLAEVIEIHRDQILRYGGNPGIHDLALLTSALAMPQAMFDGALLHQGHFEIGAAYAFHICQNHPFIDGNKGVGLAAVLVYLLLNGVKITDPRGELYDVMMETASGRKGKGEIALALKRLANQPPS
jgi:death on curing protein